MDRVNGRGRPSPARTGAISALRTWLVIPLLLALLPVAASTAQNAPVPALDSPVVDTTGTLDAGTRQQLEAQAIDLQRRKGSQLQVLMVPTTGSESIEAYSVRTFEAWKLGRTGVDDGVLLVVAKDDRAMRIEVGYGLEGAIPDATADRVVQDMLVPAFRAGDFNAGILAGTQALVGLIDGEPLPEPDRSSGVVAWSALDTALLAGMLLALLVGASWQRLRWTWWIGLPIGIAVPVGAAALAGGAIASIVTAVLLPCLLPAGYYAGRGTAMRWTLGVIAAAALVLLCASWVVLGKIPTLLAIGLAEFCLALAGALLWTAIVAARDRWQTSKGGFFIRLLVFAALAGGAMRVLWAARSSGGLAISLAAIFSIVGFFVWIVIFTWSGGASGRGAGWSHSSSGRRSSSSSSSGSGSSWSGGGGRSGGGGASGKW